MNALDLLRILGGLIIFNAFLSWWFTSTGTWGYDGRNIDPHFWLSVAGVAIYGTPHFTMAQLREYNGHTKSRVYVAINGTVFDVTRKRHLYTGSGSYRRLAGNDCSRVLVTGCLGKADEYTHDLRGLDPLEIEENLGSWLRYYSKHRDYWKVATVEWDPVTGDEPTECQHSKKPSN